MFKITTLVFDWPSPPLKYKTVLSPWWRQFTGDMNTFLPITLRYRNLTQYTVFNWTQFNTPPYHYIKRIPCTNGIGGSSVVTVTRVQTVGYQARVRGFSFVLSLQIGIEAHINSFEWVLQIKRPGSETDYHQYSSTKMEDQPAVIAHTVLLLFYRGDLVLWQAANIR